MEDVGREFLACANGEEQLQRVMVDTVTNSGSKLGCESTVKRGYDGIGESCRYIFPAASLVTRTAQI